MLNTARGMQIKPYDNNINNNNNNNKIKPYNLPKAPVTRKGILTIIILTWHIGRYSTVFDGIRQHWTALDGIGRYWTAFDGIGRHWTALDGTGRHVMALDGRNTSTVSTASDVNNSLERFHLYILKHCCSRPSCGSTFHRNASS